MLTQKKKRTVPEYWYQRFFLKLRMPWNTSSPTSAHCGPASACLLCWVYCQWLMAIYTHDWVHFFNEPKIRLMCVGLTQSSDLFNILSYWPSTKWAVLELAAKRVACKQCRQYSWKTSEKEGPTMVQTLHPGTGFHQKSVTSGESLELKVRSQRYWHTTRSLGDHWRCSKPTARFLTQQNCEPIDPHRYEPRKRRVLC